ncbi:MAG: Crp/Fnr family transcriptional regulator [Bacillota bacterium]|jgi:CRP-like cAMP-binding protein
MKNIIKEYRSVLENSVLFSGLNDSRLEEHLQYYRAAVKVYDKGDFLVGTEEKMKHFGLVLRGSVQAVMDDINGDRIIMANVSEGVTFGEALCFTGRLTDIFITATTDCRILWLSCYNIRKNLQLNTEAERRFTNLLANRTLQMNDRIQVLSKKSLRAKLNTFFTQCMVQYKNTDFVLDMDRESMAAYLGIDRSALSRELSKMRSEGLLEFRKNRFKLLKADLKHSCN